MHCPLRSRWTRPQTRHRRPSADGLSSASSSGPLHDQRAARPDACPLNANNSKPLSVRSSRNGCCWAMRSSTRHSHPCARSWTAWPRPSRLNPAGRRSSRSPSSSSTSSAPPRSASTSTPRTSSAVMDGALARCSAVVEAAPRQGAAIRRRQPAGGLRRRRVRARTTPSVRCAAAWRCSTLGRRSAASEVQAAHGHAGFNVRVGIHTGGVLLGGGVDAEGTIRGIAVNIAARMEQTAPAGALRISHDTYRHVRGVFDVEPQPPHRRSRASTSRSSRYLVLRAKPRSFRVGTRGIEGVATRMVGRDAEFDAAAARLRTRLFVERRLVVVTVVAEAGIGKSRLLYEFETWAEAQPRALLRLPGPRHAADPEPAVWLAARHLFAWRLQIADDDSSKSPRRKLERGHRAALRCTTMARDLAEAHAHLLGHLLGLDFSGQPPCQRHPRRPEADPQPRLPCRSADLSRASRAATAARSCWSSKICTGPTTARWTS